jgi:hypothetical protein
MSNCKNPNDGYVYFIRAGVDGPIKIGYSKHKDAESRLTTAQVYNPVQLTLLSIVSGGRHKERELHQKFDGYCIHGEWFSPCEELSTLIKSLKYLGLTVVDFRRPAQANIDHYAWKADKAGRSSKRSRTARRFKIDAKQKCQNCFTKKAIDRHHKDHNLDNIDPKNILLVCRSCCMYLDGRVNKLRAMDRSYQIKPPSPCMVCKKLTKPLRKGRCHSCNELFRRTGKDRNEI